METLNTKFARKAAKDKTLMASAIENYAQKKGLSWGEIADQLWIDDQRLAKLALCQRPRKETLNEDMRKISGYAGVDQKRLVGFIGSNGNSAAKAPTRRKAAKPAPKKNYGIPRMAWAVAFAVVALLAVSAFIFMQPQDTAATLVVSAGQTTISNPGKSIAILPNSGEKVYKAGQIAAVRQGDKIIVGRDSQAQIKLIDGSTVDLVSGTNLVVNELYVTESDYRVRLRVLTGRTLSRVKKILEGEDAFEIITPSSTASVRGTVFSVWVLSPESAYFATEEGTVQVQMGDQVVLVHAGEHLVATVDETLQVLSQTVPPQTLDASAVPPVDPALLPATQPTAYPEDGITPVDGEDDGQGDDSQGDDSQGDDSQGDDSQGDDQDDDDQGDDQDDDKDDDKDDDDQGDDQDDDKDKDKDKDNDNNKDGDKDLPNDDKVKPKDE